MSDDFGAVVEQELILPLKGLCELFAEEGAYAELAWFSNVLNMLGEPADEASVLRGVIELSKCAFLGFMYSYEASAQIDSLLERAINLTHHERGKPNRRCSLVFAVPLFHPLGQIRPSQLYVLRHRVKR